MRYRKKIQRFFIFILSVHVIQISCHKDYENPIESGTFTSYDWNISTPEEQGLDSEILSRAMAEAKEMNFITSLLIVKDGYLVAEAYYKNSLDKDHVWDVRSVTKSFVSALIGITLKEGYIESLNQTLDHFFPEYFTDLVDPRKKEITIRDLLTMTSGYPSDAAMDTLAPYGLNNIGDIFYLPLQSDPGEEFRYSSHSTHLLSGIITKASGMNTGTFAKRYLFDPLQISPGYWAEDLYGIPYGGAGMYLTPRDMARFGYLYLKNGSVEGREILSTTWVSESFQNHAGGDWTWAVMDEGGYGYLWWRWKIGDYQTYMAIGYAGQFIILIPQFDMVVVNTASFPKTVEEANQQYVLFFELFANSILQAVNE